MKRSLAGLVEGRLARLEREVDVARVGTWRAGVIGGEGRDA